MLGISDCFFDLWLKIIIVVRIFFVVFAANF